MKRAGNPSKTSQPYIASYEKGGMVKKPTGGGGVYTAEIGDPPRDIDGASAPRKSTQKDSGSTATLGGGRKVEVPSGKELYWDKSKKAYGTRKK